MKVGSIDDPVWNGPNDPSVLAQDRHNRKHSVLVLVLMVLVGITLIYPAAAAVLSRKDYGTLAFWKVPNRIDYCGRRYYDGGAVSGTPTQFQSEDGDKGAKWAFLSWTFSGRSIDAVVSTADGHRQTLCAGALYIPIGGGRWEDYSLSGGP